MKKLKVYPVINKYVVIAEEEKLFGDSSIMECVAGSSAIDYSSSEWMYQDKCVPGDIFELTFGIAARGLRAFSADYFNYADTISGSISFTSDYPYEYQMPIKNAGSAKFISNPNWNQDYDPINIDNWNPCIDLDYKEFTVTATLPQKYVDPFGEYPDGDLSKYDCRFDWAVQVTMQQIYSDVPELSAKAYIWLFGAVLKKNGEVIKRISFPATDNVKTITSGKQNISNLVGKTPWTRYGLS